MFKNEKTAWGYRITFGDFMKEPEVKAWVEDARKVLAGSPPKFGVFIDMRALKPLPPESQAELAVGQKLFKAKGMQRSVVILSSAAIVMQFKRMAKETGIYEWERYIDASKHSDFEKPAVDWLTKGIDPDKEASPAK